MPHGKLRHIYVVSLKKTVLKNAKFKRANPNYVRGKRCVYVGLTAIEPAERLAQHKMGKRASRYVKSFGKNLLPGLGSHTSRSYRWALKKERRVAAELRKKGYGVWQN